MRHPPKVQAEGAGRRCRLKLTRRTTDGVPQAIPLGATQPTARRRGIATLAVERYHGLSGGHSCHPSWCRLRLRDPVGELRGQSAALVEKVLDVAAAAERRVPMVLDCVVGAAVDILGHVGPLVADDALQLQQLPFLIEGPRALPDVQIKVVVPPLSALLSGAPGKLLRDERPAPRPVDPNALPHFRVLLGRPLLPLQKTRVEVVADRIEIVTFEHDGRVTVVAGAAPACQEGRRKGHVEFRMSHCFEHLARAGAVAVAAIQQHDVLLVR